MKITTSELNFVPHQFAEFEPLLIDFDNGNYWEHPLLDSYSFESISLKRYHLRNSLGQYLDVVVKHHDDCDDSTRDPIIKLAVLFGCEDDVYFIPESHEGTWSEPPVIGKELLPNNEYAANFFKEEVKVIREEPVQVDYDIKRNRWFYKTDVELTDVEVA
jgi:hypothetical protein